jgi:hypothetical protein
MLCCASCWKWKPAKVDAPLPQHPDHSVAGHWLYNVHIMHILLLFLQELEACKG